MSEDEGGIGCDLCTNGTFVSPAQAPGTQTADCQVCPTGTDKNTHAGFRACRCLEGYYRKDRFGPCMLCPEEGIDCTDEYQKLKPGFWWTWNFSTASIVPNSNTKYKTFVDNLQTYSRYYNTTNTYFDGPLPQPFACLRGNDSCPSANGIDESCGQGYEGWLCSQCTDGYYPWFEYCVKCPPVWHLVLEILLVLVLVTIIVAITVWDIKRREKTTRSLTDVLIARFKIVLGYYQIAGAIFTSLHNIHWPQEISKLATIFEALELNIFKLLAKPRCYSSKLKLNIYIEFILGLSFCIAVVLLPLIIYICRRIHLHFKFSKYGQISYRAAMAIYLTKLKSKCCLFVMLLLFISYLSLCDVILSLMPVACQQFCLDENNVYCTQRLRSDFSIDCETDLHRNYINAAYCALLYVIGYPLVVFLVILKNSPGKVRTLQESNDDDNESTCTEESTVEDEDEDAENNNCHEDIIIDTSQNDADSKSVCSESGSSEEMVTVLRDRINDEPEHSNDFKYPLYIRFLCENYKPEYWYWEIVELSRKVLQTSLVVLYGSEDPLTLGATIGLSMVFITSHAYFKPMKDSFEHWLQMTSLVAIFLNLLSAEVLLVPIADPSGGRQTAMAIFIITLNVAVVLLAFGKYADIFSQY